MRIKKIRRSNSHPTVYGSDVFDCGVNKMVDVARFELATPAMSMQCSTAELYVHQASAFSGACDSKQVQTWSIRCPSNLLVN